MDFSKQELELFHPFPLNSFLILDIFWFGILDEINHFKFIQGFQIRKYPKSRNFFPRAYIIRRRVTGGTHLHQWCLLGTGVLSPAM